MRTPACRRIGGAPSRVQTVAGLGAQLAPAGPEGAAASPCNGFGGRSGSGCGATALNPGDESLETLHGGGQGLLVWAVS